MTYDIIATGSKGNAVVINGNILIDCGVPYKQLEPYAAGLKLVLLTHEHGDHFRPETVRRLHKMRPALRWGCCEWMVPHLLAAGVSKRVIDVMSCREPGDDSPRDIALDTALVYKGISIVRPERLTHNVPNCGWHVHPHGESLFYATDTGTLDGVSACGYDLYMIEANHTEAEIEERIRAKRDAGEYAYEMEARRNHLSFEQAMNWLAENAGPRSEVIFMHQHQEKETGDNGMVRSASDNGEASENAYACAPFKD